MDMKIEVIGATNKEENIAKLLGVKDESEYGLYKVTAKGQYYAKRLPDGTLDVTKLVRLLSDEQAAELEAEICALINRESAKISEIAKTIPLDDPEKMKQRIMEIGEELGEKARNTINGLSLKGLKG